MASLCIILICSYLQSVFASGKVYMVLAYENLVPLLLFLNIIITSCMVKAILLYLSRTYRKCTYSHLCCCSTDRLRFYLRGASKAGIEERGFGCSIYPIRETLGNHIHRIISCSSASHKIMFRFLLIIAGEETGRKRVRSNGVLPQRIMVYLLVPNVDAQGPSQENMHLVVALADVLKLAQNR